MRREPRPKLKQTQTKRKASIAFPKVPLGDRLLTSVRLLLLAHVRLSWLLCVLY